MGKTDKYFLTRHLYCFQWHNIMCTHNVYLFTVCMNRFTTRYLLLHLLRHNVDTYISTAYMITIYCMYIDTYLFTYLQYVYLFSTRRQVLLNAWLLSLLRFYVMFPPDWLIHCFERCFKATIRHATFPSTIGGNLSDNSIHLNLDSIDSRQRLLQQLHQKLRSVLRL